MVSPLTCENDVEKTRLTLRLPPDLAEQAAVVAAYQGLTMNAFIVQAVRNWTEFQAKRAMQAVSVKASTTAVRRPATPATTTAQRVLSDPLDRPLRNGPKVGPNEPCPCGSGQKYKRCHGKPGQA